MLQRGGGGGWWRENRAAVSGGRGGVRVVPSAVSTSVWLCSCTDPGTLSQTAKKTRNRGIRKNSHPLQNKKVLVQERERERERERESERASERASERERERERKRAERGMGPAHPPSPRAKQRERERDEGTRSPGGPLQRSTRPPERGPSSPTLGEPTMGTESVQPTSPPQLRRVHLYLAVGDSNGRTGQLQLGHPPTGTSTTTTTRVRVHQQKQRRTHHRTKKQQRSPCHNDRNHNCTPHPKHRHQALGNHPLPGTNQSTPGPAQMTKLSSCRGNSDSAAEAAAAAATDRATTTTTTHLLHHHLLKAPLLQDRPPQTRTEPWPKHAVDCCEY